MNRRPKDRLAKPIEVPLDTRGFGLPKPVRQEKPTRITRSGRLIENREDYKRTKQWMWQQQQGICGIPHCGRLMPTPAYGHRHHPAGRGLGGGKRDDSETVLVCIPCHREAHGQ